MERPNSPMDYVKLDTYLMRSSSDAEYIYLREVLLEQGVDLGRAVVACYYDDGGAFYGVVVTPDRKVVESIYSTCRTANARSQGNRRSGQGLSAGRTLPMRTTQQRMNMLLARSN